ncbi:hypothetical protein GBAR_LOCUS16865 [Geodia barretti]|uniref:Uncharacterized protein n=1 Tax=Geodia barretti TaxID=519541 RepID=A0AA35SIE6_GEOBA|nr:hypothetical protein GBAR_LOCUS16865 [Geodia barretti]
MKRVDDLETENAEVLSKNASSRGTLKNWRGKSCGLIRKADLQEKLTELKQIIQAHLQQTSTTEEGNSSKARRNLKRWVSLPSLKLGEGEEDEGLKVAGQVMLSAKCYVSTSVRSTSTSMPSPYSMRWWRGKLITSQEKGNAEAYSSTYAQNISAGVALFNTGEPTHICTRSVQYSRGH